MTFPRKFAFVLFLTAFLITLSFEPRARAADSAPGIGDAALTVAVATVAGAVLGASTLPFYEESGEHTQNIFYGAAIGAVIGVFVSAYAGVQSGPDYEEGRLAPTKPSALALNESAALRYRGESSSALRKPASFSAGSTVAWSPVASFKF